MTAPTPVWATYPPQSAVPPAPVAQPAPVPAARPSRDRYLDMLRALALGRVVTFHTFGWAWLPIVFPSMGVMFALAGSLMARSLSRPALSVIRGRLRRLLPPVWLFGLVVLPGMFLQGWTPSASPDATSWWLKMFFWVVPLSDPPFPDVLHNVHGLLDKNWGQDAAVPLWYLRAYLWFVLLSPLLLRAVRRMPWTTMMAPFALCVVLDLELIDVPDRVYGNLSGFSTYGACWILGMAYQEGLLSRIPRYLAPSLLPFVMAGALWWAIDHTPQNTVYSLDSTTVSQAVWSFGFVFLLLQASPSWTEWPPRLKRWHGLIGLLNSRAVTVYLWHNLMINAALSLVNLLWYVPPVAESVPWLLDSNWPAFLLTMPLLTLCVLAFGWIEDVAAKRRPRLFPWPRSPKPAHSGRRAI